jgi:hypothetical protein
MTSPFGAAFAAAPFPCGTEWNAACEAARWIRSGGKSWLLAGLPFILQNQLRTLWHNEALIGQKLNRPDLKVNNEFSV